MKYLLLLISLFFFVSCDSKTEDDSNYVPPTRAEGPSIYVSDVGTFSPPFKIMKYDAEGNFPETFINSNLSWPQDILFIDSLNMVLISNFNSGLITKYNNITGAYLGVFASGLSSPTRMKVGPDGLLYVLQWSGSFNVRRYTMTGTIKGDFTSVGVNASIGIDWDKDGNLYVSSYYDDLVRKFDKDGKDLGNFISTNLVGPTNIWFDDAGTLFVVDYDGGSVKKFSSTGVYQGVFISGLGKAEGIAHYPNGDILIGNGATSSLKRYTKSGVYIKDQVLKGKGGLITPNAVVFH